MHTQNQYKWFKCQKSSILKWTDFTPDIILTSSSALKSVRIIGTSLMTVWEFTILSLKRCHPNKSALIVWQKKVPQKRTKVSITPLTIFNLKPPLESSEPQLQPWIVRFELVLAPLPWLGIIRYTVNQLCFATALISRIWWSHTNQIGLYKENPLLSPRKGPNPRNCTVAKLSWFIGVSRDLPVSWSPYISF